MAAPHVAGLAALLWSARPQATLDDIRNAILSSAAALTGTKRGRIDAARAMAALVGDTGTGSSGEFILSRSSLLFASARGQVPRAQSISIRADGGSVRRWTARADVRWVQPGTNQGDTPAWLSVRVDPSGLAPGDYVGHVRIESPEIPSDAAVLEVKLRVGAPPTLAVAGAGCAIRDGQLHVERGSTCMLATPGVGLGAAAPAVQWKLPGGALVSGAAMYGQFTRTGQYQVEVSAMEDTADTLTVVVE
jgi:hypothetical protein